MKSEAGITHTLTYTATRPMHAPSAVNGSPYTYDANGNLRAQGGETLTYDAGNRLQAITTGTGVTVTFTYDADGRRALRQTAMQMVVYVGPHYEVHTTRGDLDGDGVIRVADIMRVASQWGNAGGPEDFNSDGVVDVVDVQLVAGVWRAPAQEVVKYYTLGGQRIAMRREPVGQGDTLYYLFTDHLGSTSVTYNTATGQAQAIRYYPWGTIRSGGGNGLPTDYTFTGQRLDPATGLMYYSDGTSYGRYYDPALGRWVQPDIIVPDYSNPQSLNRYAYVYNRPTVLADPDGHCPLCVAIGVGVVVLKVVDWGWTAYDAWQASRVLADPNASAEAKAQASADLALIAASEALEPDELLPIALPLDDLARKASLKAGEEIVERVEKKTASEVYQGVRQASAYLQEQGVPRHYRKQILESFEIETIRVRVAGPDEFGIRYYDDVNAFAKGRYLFETFPASRESLAIRPEWNQMRYFRQWRIRPGTIMIEGRTASQGLGYPGGQIQKFILYPDRDLLP